MDSSAHKQADITSELTFKRLIRDGRMDDKVATWPYTDNESFLSNITEDELSIMSLEDEDAMVTLVSPHPVRSAAE